MLQHVSFKDWNPIGKPTGPKTPPPDGGGGKKGAELGKGSNFGNDRVKSNNMFGEAAILELSSDYVVGKKATTGVVYAKQAGARVLKIGSSGQDVRNLQMNLRQLGYNTINTINGSYDNRTERAVRIFQKAYGLQENGIADSRTQDAIADTLSWMKKGVLTKGQTGSEVTFFQKKLYDLGYLSSNPDGIFGTEMEQAVKSIQSALRLSSDGKINASTKSAITSEEKRINNLYKTINGGNSITLPKPGTEIEISFGTDKPKQKAVVAKTDAWSIETTVAGAARLGGAYARRVKSATDNFAYNKGKADLLELNVPKIGTCYAGAMIEGFGRIGDVAEITLDNGKKFNFMILDVKSNKHRSSELSEDQCQNQWGHGYMIGKNTVQLSVCEFILSQDKYNASNASSYPSGNFLSGRKVTSARIIGHANIDS
ncbi:MAG: peptidoglycan-binding protein [Lachnospiraceae bacterium]|nr:peptidoglycan-binding protein [Lachnospiraceae bacterium]